MRPYAFFNITNIIYMIMSYLCYLYVLRIVIYITYWLYIRVTWRVSYMWQESLVPKCISGSWWCSWSFLSFLFLFHCVYFRVMMSFRISQKINRCASYLCYFCCPTYVAILFYFASFSRLFMVDCIIRSYLTFIIVYNYIYNVNK